MAIDQKIIVPVVALASVLMASFPLFNEYILKRCDGVANASGDCPNCPVCPACPDVAADCPECMDCTEFAPKCPKCPKCKSSAVALTGMDAARKFTYDDAHARLLYTGYSDVSLWGHKSFKSYYHNILPQKNQQFKFFEPVTDFALYAERDLGGWNNIRMAYEVEVCLAYKYRRAMGMPRKTRFYLVDAPAISIFDFYDEEHFRAVIPTVDYYGPNGERDGDKPKLEGEVYSVPKDYSITDQVKKRKTMDELPVDKHWHFGESRGGGTRIFEQYTELVEFQPKEAYIKLIHQAFRMKESIVDKTIAILLENGLQPYTYNAMHVRRNEFQYNDVRHVSIQKIFDHVKPYIKDQPLLIISDEYSEELKKLMERAASRVVFLRCKGKCQPDQLSIDMLAAVPSMKFFGSPLSTFSAGIAQWRNRCNPDTKIRHTMPYTQDMKALPTWGRPGEVVMPVVTNVWKDIGFEKLSVHHEIRRILEDLYIDEREQWNGERSVDFIKSTQRPINKQFPKDLVHRMDALVRPLLEQWVGFELEPAGDHVGLREYQQGTTVSKNRETKDRIVSAAFVVRGSNTPWSLSIRDRTSTVHSISFDDGDMFFYAGHGLEKSRKGRLQGKFAVAYSHYKPKDFDSCATLDCNYCGETCDAKVRRK